MRREIADMVALRRHTVDLFSTEEFLSACSVSVPQLEKLWAGKTSVPATKSREPFRKFLGALLTEKRTAPSLKPTTNERGFVYQS